MVQLSIGDIWDLPIVYAYDDVDGDLSNLVNVDKSEIIDFEIDDNIYLFDKVGLYTVIFSVSDNAGNKCSYTLIIKVENTDFDWTKYNSYYTSLSTSDNIITDLAYLLRGTINYVSYGDARYVYTVDNNGNQVILYDYLGSPSYGQITADGLLGWGDGGVINGNNFTITINREHIWACNDMQIKPENNSRSLSTYVPYILNDGSYDYRPNNSNKGHFSDLHNIWNSIAGFNSSHSDHFYGEENGNSIFPYLKNSIFYPGDEYKGDIARILFYMSLMYPELTLVNKNDSNAIEGSVYYGYLDVLLRWNEEDPISDYEIARNENIFLIQGNRNPFIDYYYEGIASIIFKNGDPNVIDIIN